VIVFFEGETEEQALPLLAQHFFNKSPVEMGLDFVSVDGHKSYLTFLKFAESFNIPWFILSDAEELVYRSVRNQLEELKGSGHNFDNVVFMDAGNNWEKQLIQEGYKEEIRKAMAKREEYCNERHREAKGSDRLAEIEGYNDSELLEIIKNNKTRYGAPIAEEIVASRKPLPPKVVHLFQKIQSLLQNEEDKV
jgi:putative ATP-dependent endonuclease of OLD family